MTVRRPALLLAAFLLALSLGLPWATHGGSPGSTQPARVTALAAVLLLGLAIRRGSRPMAAAALLVAAVALPLGLSGNGLQPGRLAYLGAVLAAAAAVDVPHLGRRAT